MKDDLLNVFIIFYRKQTFQILKTNQYEHNSLYGAAYENDGLDDINIDAVF